MTTSNYGSASLGAEASDAYAVPVSPGPDAVLSPTPLASAAPPTVVARRKIGVWFAVGWLALVTLLAAAADLLPLKDPAEFTSQLSLAPGFRLDEPLGTDHLGRSMTSRIVYGGRVSLTVCLGATALAFCVGMVIGLAGGYFRGAFDSVLDIVINAMLAFPPLIFLIAVTTILEPSIPTLTVSLALLGIPTVVRVARANAISVAEREYIVASRAMGVRTLRILYKDVLPNVLPSVMSFSLVAAAALIVAEGSLSFLGLGVRPPTPSWGVMISDSIPQLRTYPYQMLVPSTVFFLTVLSLNTVGNWARAKAEGRSR